MTIHRIRICKCGHEEIALGVPEGQREGEQVAAASYAGSFTPQVTHWVWTDK